MPRKNTLDEFWTHVDVRGDNECWEWLRSTDTHGYGRFRMGGRLITSHRIALSSVTHVPSDKYVLHTCDNRICCNPAHLFLGTHADNMRDMKQKGRHRSVKGELHSSSRLAECDAFFIKHSDIKGVTLARIFGVDTSTISLIRSGKTWKHLP